jgi:pyruvate dehydrogenase E1 component alpha subunit
MEYELALKIYKNMLLSRALDEKCKQLLELNVFVPNFHSGTGQEATSVVPPMALGKSDYYFYTHRDYGGLIARGVPLIKVVGDLMLKKSGSNQGFGGIMHSVSPELGIVGRNGVFGSRFGIAAGVAMKIKLKNQEGVVLCAYGEAEGSRGPIYEALNFSVLRGLPIIFLAENNGFSISARTNELYAGGNMSDLFRGFDIPIESVDGNSVLEIWESVNRLREESVKHQKPALLECRTYRIDPHIPTDKELYRPKDEVIEQRKRDPILQFENYLTLEGKVKYNALSRMKESAKQEIEKVFTVVLREPYATLKEMERYVYFSRM